jgi:hypothetical protein
VLEFIRRDALAVLVPALPIPANPDLKALPVGRREDGLPWLVKLRGTHALIAGATGAGKASLLGEDTLARRRRVLGEDHPDTLASAHGLAISLRAVGERQAARELDEDTLARRRRVLGEDYPDTLASADNLAFSLQGVRGQAARELGEDTLARRRRVLGEDHPDTLASASNLVMILGEYQAARELAEDILARRRRVLGEDHPDTGASATFAIFLRTPRMLLKTIRWHSRRRRAG